MYEDVIKELAGKFIDEGMENNEAEHKAGIAIMSLLTDVMRKAEMKVESVIKTSGFKDIIDQYASIHIGDDVQQLDSDVFAYDPDDEESLIVIFSCKTLLRERAGQTYKWKLMCDLATCKCEHMKDNPECTTITKEIEDDDNVISFGDVIANLNAFFPDNNKE